MSYNSTSSSAVITKDTNTLPLTGRMRPLRATRASKVNYSEQYSDSEWDGVGRLLLNAEAQDHDDGSDHIHKDNQQLSAEIGNARNESFSSKNNVDRNNYNEENNNATTHCGQSHQSDHEVDETNQPKAKKKRHRRSYNCGPCKKHKIKCDTRIPCGNCLRLNRIDQCMKAPATAPTEEQITIKLKRRQKYLEKQKRLARLAGQSNSIQADDSQSSKLKRSLSSQRFVQQSTLHSSAAPLLQSARVGAQDLSIPNEESPQVIQVPHGQSYGPYGYDTNIDGQMEQPVQIGYPVIYASSQPVPSIEQQQMYGTPYYTQPQLQLQLQPSLSPSSKFQYSNLMPTHNIPTVNGISGYMEYHHHGSQPNQQIQHTPSLPPLPNLLNPVAYNVKVESAQTPPSHQYSREQQHRQHAYVDGYDLQHEQGIQQREQQNIHYQRQQQQQQQQQHQREQQQQQHQEQQHYQHYRQQPEHQQQYQQPMYAQQPLQTQTHLQQAHVNQHASFSQTSFSPTPTQAEHSGHPHPHPTQPYPQYQIMSPFPLQYPPSVPNSTHPSNTHGHPLNNHHSHSGAPLPRPSTWSKQTQSTATTNSAASFSRVYTAASNDSGVNQVTRVSTMTSTDYPNTGGSMEGSSKYYEPSQAIRKRHSIEDDNPRQS